MKNMEEKKKEKNRDTLLSLPLDLLGLIGSFLSAKEITQLNCVNKAWNVIWDTDEIWLVLLRRDLPLWSVIRPFFLSLRDCKIGKCSITFSEHVKLAYFQIVPKAILHRDIVQYLDENDWARNWYNLKLQGDNFSNTGEQTLDHLPSTYITNIGRGVIEQKKLRNLSALISEINRYISDNPSCREFHLFHRFFPSQPFYMDWKIALYKNIEILHDYTEEQYVNMRDHVLWRCKGKLPSHLELIPYLTTVGSNYRDFARS
jgi:hypothetical protein